MNYDIDTLRREHAHIRNVLDLLEQGLSALAEGDAGAIHYLQSVAGFMSHFPARVHHPREELLCDFVVFRFPEMREEADRLVREHTELMQADDDFLRHLQHLQPGGEKNVAATLEAGRRYLRAYRDHLAFEEDRLFPVAEDCLDEVDWFAIRARWQKIDHPPYGAHDSYRAALWYRALTDRTPPTGRPEQ